jgi:hypothetical protein
MIENQMNYLSANEIKNKVNDLLEKIDCPKNEISLPTYESAIGDGTPYIMAKINEDWAKLLSKEHKKLLIGMK